MTGDNRWGFFPVRLPRRFDAFDYVIDEAVEAICRHVEAPK